MPIGALVPGTKENIRITMVDRSELITDLSSSTPSFTVKNESDTAMVTDAAATASGLVITAPLDTTVGGIWAEGEYRMFIKYTVSAEVIIKGPFYFMLVFT